MKLTTHLHLVRRSRNVWSYTSTPQYAFMAWCLVKHRDKFTCTFTLLEGGEWLASWSGRLTPEERAPGTHCEPQSWSERGGIVKIPDSTGNRTSAISWLSHGRKYFFLLPYTDQLGGPPSLLFKKYRGLFPGGRKQPERKFSLSLPSSDEVMELCLGKETDLP
jgi:hypothetical protein